MKEILYIQAGTFANYIGTHFWNTQESYFTYNEEDAPDVVHDVSFREGFTPKGESTFCPRLLLFDRKSNFGTLSSTRGLYGDNNAESDLEPLWGGSVVEYRQDLIPKSSYHTQLDAEAEDAGGDDTDEHEKASAQSQDVRYWSDNSRVFFHPRTLQPLPDLAEWESGEGDWNAGKEEFTRHDRVMALMEDSFRLFVEECDALQGIQVMHDTATFGPFTDSFLTAFRDEFPKLSCLTFPLLSGVIPGSIDADDTLAMRTALNDALCLYNLDALATLTVPLQAPSTWSAGEWLDELALNRSSPYHTSALLSAHIESATLPFRLKRSTDDLASVCGALSAGGQLRLAHLSGAFPRAPCVPPRLHDLSALRAPGSPPPYAQLFVARGFSAPDARAFADWCDVRPPAPRIIYAPAYPLPSSFPLTVPAVEARRGCALASLASMPAAARLLAAHAALVADAVRRGTDVGVELDDLREVGDALWALADGYAGEEGAQPEDAELGEDEE